MGKFYSPSRDDGRRAEASTHFWLWLDHLPGTMYKISLVYVHSEHMALHIVDPEAESAVRELAAKRGLTLTRAVEIAAREALSRDASRMSLAERLRPLQERVAAIPSAPGPIADEKEFMDAMWSRD